MRKSLIAFLIAAPSTLFAQLDPYTITIQASRNVVLPPDQAVFAVSLITTSGVSLSDAAGALQGAGISNAAFTGLRSDDSGSARNPQTNLAWNFELDVPFSNLSSTVSSLASAVNSIQKARPGWSVTFTLVGTRLSSPPSCSIPDLVSDARAQAQKLASAAGFTLGTVSSVSTGTAGSAIYVASLVEISGIMPGVFTPPPQPCTIAVKFKLIGN